MLLPSSIRLIESKEIERAIYFLADEYRKSGRNPKPVVFHSLRVAYTLLEIGYRNLPIIAGILHDVLEDTDADSKELRKQFGPEVARCVESLTENTAITDAVARYKELYGRAIKYGKDACVVRAADLLDNLRYFWLVEDAAKRNTLFKKVRYFIEYARVLQEEPILRMLQKNLDEISCAFEHS